MAGWQKVRLDSIQAPQKWAMNGGPFGSKLTQKDYVERGVPVIRGTNLSGGTRFSSDSFVFVSESKADELRANIALPGDVVFTQRGTLGDVGLVPSGSFERYVISQSQMKLTVNPVVADARFVYYVFKSTQVREAIRGLASTSGVPHINLATLREFEVTLPPLRDQRQIADVLDGYEALLENSGRRISTLDGVARTLYRHWFGTSNAGEALPVQRLIDDGVIEINDGYRAKNDELGGPGLPFARAGDIDNGFHLTDADTLHESNIARAGAKICRDGDVVFTSKGTVGRFAWVRSRTPQFVYSPQLCFWRVWRPDVLSPRYLWRWMTSPAFVMQLDRVKGSTDMADYVSLTDQRRMLVDVPLPSLQREFDEAVAPIDDLIDGLRERIANLRATRDLLLPRLISGELDVSRVPDPASL